MKYTIEPVKREQTFPARSMVILLTMLTILIGISTVGYSQDPRVPADSHPLAPAVGRMKNSSGDPACTGWITKGGILITAGHCHNDAHATMIEFNVPLSSSNGTGNPSDAEDQYTISEWVDWNNNNANDNDWAIFRVDDNPITGLQPIEAQLVYIDLQQDLTGDSCRTMGYGRDSNPNGSSGGYNNYHHTLQMDVGANQTSNPTGNTVKCMTYGERGDSGGPIIDESSNAAIGIVHTANYTPARKTGTSTHRSSFWNAYQAEQSFFILTVTQKDEGGSALTGSTISRWDVGDSDFDDYTLSGSSVNLDTAYEGNAEVFRGDQNVYHTPEEKYNEWSGFNDVRNHQVFQLQDQPYISQFEKTYSNITVTTAFPEYPSADGSGQIEFKDPWLIDYEDPSFDNNTRNRGMDAVFYNHSAPFTPGFSSINGKLYNGLFLNEGSPNFAPPFYSVRADESQTVNFGGLLGSRQAFPIGWEGDDADFEEPDNSETAVSFTDTGAEARAKLKISRVSTNTNAFRAGGHR